MINIPRPVWLLGWASLFTDAATEMIYPLLPVFLSRVLGASALSLGVIEGVAEGVNSVLKVISGYISDRRQRRRPIVCDTRCPRWNGDDARWPGHGSRS